MVEARTGMQTNGPAYHRVSAAILFCIAAGSGQSGFARQIYVIAYILIVSTISQVIYLAAKFDMQEPQHVMRAKQLDRYAVLLQIAVFRA